MVEIQLCKLRGTSDTLIGRAFVLCSICIMVFVNYIYDTVVGTHFHKFHGRPFARVLHVFLMTNIYQVCTKV